MRLIALLAGLIFSISLSSAEVAEVTVKEAVARMKKEPKLVVIDVRTPREFAKGHIKGAINLNMRDKDFAERLAKLDRKKTYLMHCASGGRSAASIPVWKQLKFEKVLHLTAGAKGWQKAGQTLVIPKKK